MILSKIWYMFRVSCICFSTLRDIGRGGAIVKEKLKTFFAVCVLIITIPYIVTLLFQGIETSPSPEKVKSNAQGTMPLTVQTDGQEVEVEEYLAAGAGISYRGTEIARIHVQGGNVESLGARWF